MSHLDELFQAMKDLMEVQEKAKALQERINELKERLLPEQQATFASVIQPSHSSWETKINHERLHGKQDSDMERVRAALRSSNKALMSKELRAETGFDSNRMNNTLWLMREELDKLPANPKRKMSSQNMAYRLKR